MVIGILLGLLAFATMGIAAAATCHIYSQRRIRKEREKVHRNYLREQAILQQNYFNTYFAMLQAAQRHTNN